MLSLLSLYLWYGTLVSGGWMLLARTNWIFDLLIHFTMQYVFVALLAACLLMLQRSYVRAAIAVFCAALAFFVTVHGNGFVGAVWSASPTSQELIVLQANVNMGNKNPDALAARIFKERPDILTLNEVPPAWLSALKEKTGDWFAYSLEATHDSYRGMAILSRLPLDNGRVIPFSDEESPLLQAEIRGYDLSIYAIHTLSPVSAHWSALRDAQIAALGRLVSEDTHARIVVSGDFNSSVQSPALQSFFNETKLGDSRLLFRWQPTWMAGTPLAVAIDHVLFKGDLRSAGFTVLDPIGSDHRPVVARLIVMDNSRIGE